MPAISRFYVGTQFEESSPTSGGQRALLDPDKLTTHAIIVGMTGSGKTGLGIVLVEEALRAGIPALVLDPKGDMGNLGLVFPTMEANDFRPWLQPQGGTPSELDSLAQATASHWRTGLEGCGLGSDAMSELKQRAEVAIYTPGSTVGTPINALGSLAAPKVLSNSLEQMRAEIATFTTGMLGLVGMDADPLTSREHIFLANIIEQSWSKGVDLDLPRLIHQVQKPPMRKLGVFDLDSFFPAEDRAALAMRLNALLATPSFAPWMQGEEVDFRKLLWTEEGRARAAIVYLAHLSEQERQFIVSLLLSKLATWMQTQSGSAALRALVYVDEAFGFAPPTAVPPAKKPILTLMKQARAFGIGMVLSTQNPVDLDYKVMSNAGTWMIGRLHTERDKARILEALSSAGGGQDAAAFDRQITHLQKRQFVLHDIRKDRPSVFSTRWAMSYLAGPLSKSQVRTLHSMLGGDESVQEEALPQVSTVIEEVVEGDTQPLPDPVADGIEVFFVDPAAPWVAKIGGDGLGKHWEAAIAARCSLRYDERRAGVDHREEWEAVLFPLTEPLDIENIVEVDYDTRDFRLEAPKAARFRASPISLHSKGLFKNIRTQLKKRLLRGQNLQLWRNAALGVYARVHEPKQQFVERCQRVAQDEADRVIAKLRNKLEKKVRRLERRVETAELRLDNAQDRLETSQRDEMISGAGSVLGVLLGRRSVVSMARRAAGSVSSASRRRARSARLQGKIDEQTQKIEDLQQEVEDLETETSEEIVAIADEWEEKAQHIDAFSIGLERDDVDVDQVCVVWIPCNAAHSVKRN